MEAAVGRRWVAPILAKQFCQALVHGWDAWLPGISHFEQTAGKGHCSQALEVAALTCTWGFFILAAHAKLTSLRCACCVRPKRTCACCVSTSADEPRLTALKQVRRQRRVRETYQNIRFPSSSSSRARHVVCCLESRPTLRKHALDWLSLGVWSEWRNERRSSRNLPEVQGP